MNEHRPVQVRMMKQKARHRFLHDPALQCTVLQMQHAANATTFFIFPNRGKLGQLEGALLPETLIQWDRLLRTRWAAHSSSGEADPCLPTGSPCSGPQLVACTVTPRALSPSPRALSRASLKVSGWAPGGHTGPGVCRLVLVPG